MLADPDFVRKAEEGRADEIRQCLACTSPQCHGRIFKCLPVGCVVNPIVAREAQFPMKPAAQSKEVLVIGAGPAGMEAAITAAKRGHRVTLWEAAGEVGGQLVMGQVPPHKEMISRLLAYYRRQLELAGVRLELGKRASPEEIKRFGYDELIVATGGQPLQPPIPGAAEHAISAWEVLSGRAEVGANVAIIGGGDVGCELAEYIAGKGSQVTIVEMLDDVAPGFLIGAKPLLIREFRQLGLDYITKAKVTRIEAGSLTLDRGGVEYHMDGFDTIVLCVGTVSQNELSAALRRDGVDFYEVGDCVRPRTIYEAVTSGFEAGYSI